MSESNVRLVSGGAQPGLDAGTGRGWPRRLYEVLKRSGVSQASYVPDAGHAELITLLVDDPEITATVLTTEEEGLAISAGAWLGGKRSVVLMQSSGVGNCINTASLSAIGRFPLLMLVTMRGEWGEFNPWQVPMSRATEATLTAMGVKVMRADDPEMLIEMVESAATFALEADQQVAVLLSQRMLGGKKW
ncbi:sulfopyruvate decarboxylase alpha subunit [Rhodoligotrophos appendicifer]|uniref:thiamine pyrophosphate-binding protein n=1 Tax=Rhodoligotrophos appendicifer TaxID=987056 RepID=UPI0011855019|nr:thiamine pyrophosphate-binding protein [Rhodoligotrophos appendicifer]